MKRNVRELPHRSLDCPRDAKVHAVSCHKSPVPLQDEGFQFPIFPSRFNHPSHVGAFHETVTLGDRYHIQTQTLINQEFQQAFTSLMRGCVVAFS
jgi:hypothetical protein